MFLHYCITILSIFYGTLGYLIKEEHFNVTETVPIANATTQSPRESTVLSGVCRLDTEWQCATPEPQCINIEKKCDGVFDCMDFSDEYLETCREEKPRTLFGLIVHCSSLWTYMHEKVCPEICQKSPEFCYYALLAENHENNTCILPNYPINGTYKIMPTGFPSVPRAVDFWLNFTCNAPYVMVQKTLLQCNEGKWNSDPNENGYCSEACALNKNDNFTYICPMDVYGSTDCGDYVAIKTTVNVSRAMQDKDSKAKNVSLEMLCSEDNEFVLSTHCVKEVELMQTKFEDPTMEKMTDYENKFNQFKANETTNEFEMLVDDFHSFEREVKANMTLMHVMAERCDISLDLLLHNLQQKQKRKEETTNEV